MFPATLTRDHGHIRRILIVALATLTLFAGIALSPSANADEVVNEDPDGFKGSGNNQVSDWCDPFDGGYKDEGPATPFRVPTPGDGNPAPDDALWTILVLKSASGDQQNAYWNSPTVGNLYTHPGGQANSHSILCWNEPEEPTTTLTVTKILIPSDDPGLFNLRIDGEAKAENVGDGGTTGKVEVSVGSHTVSETAGTNTVLADYTGVIGGDCAADGTVTLKEGDDKTCTITNTLKTVETPPELKLVKVVKNGHGGEAVPGDWDLTAEGDEKGFTDKGDSDTFHEVTAGQPYALSESTVEGYYLETPPGWSCDGGKQDGATITLAAEESVTCTVINNDKKPSLKLVKEVVNDYGEAADPSEWTLTATGPRTFSGPGPVVNSPNSFQQGTYELSESVGPDGYRAGSWVCEGGSQDGASITIGLGESATCTITNTYVPPTAEPGIDIEKATNGFDADDATGPELAVGGTVTWTYVVKNTGNEPLANVTVTDDQAGVTPLYQSGDTNTDDLLDPTETWTYKATGTAVAGQYKNTGKAVGEYGEGSKVDDTDPSHYYGNIPDKPGIEIEKATNGFDADEARGPRARVGSTVTWTYVVKNTGNEPLANVTVTDDQAGVTPLYQSGDTNTDDLLDPTETWTYKATGTAVAGQYKNTGKAVGEYGEGSKVDDTDPSHYYGYRPTVDSDDPDIDIEKATNTKDADTPAEGPVLKPGSTVTWTYVVTNTGDVRLANVTVTDDQAGVTPLYQSGDTNNNNLLDLTETWTYEATGTAVVGQYKNTGKVTGSYGSDTVTDTDLSHYSGVAVAGTAQIGDTVWLDVNKNGVQDNGEVGYNGADVILKDANGNVVGTLTTATGAWVGFYKFVGLDAGTYTAMLDLSTIGTYKVSTANSFTIALAEGDDFVDADFGLYEETGAPPTTVPPTTTVPPEETLPTTGIDSEALTLLAVGLLMLGGLAILASRKRRSTN